MHTRSHNIRNLLIPWECNTIGWLSYDPIGCPHAIGREHEGAERKRRRDIWLWAATLLTQSESMGWKRSSERLSAHVLVTGNMWSKLKQTFFFSSLSLSRPYDNRAIRCEKITTKFSSRATCPQISALILTKHISSISFFVQINVLSPIVISPLRTQVELESTSCWQKMSPSVFSNNW